MPYVELLAAATAAAEAGAAVLRHHFRRAGLLVEEKAKNDYVTEADRESERTVTSELRWPVRALLAELADLSA